jgi:hypothetical protein
MYWRSQPPIVHLHTSDVSRAVQTPSPCRTGPRTDVDGVPHALRVGRARRVALQPVLLAELLAFQSVRVETKEEVGQVRGRR